jgi:NAD dependent epimerase/dehydratase family enzyme
MHDLDYCRATDLLLTHPEITAETDGIVNMTAPNPLPNRDFMRVLREAWHAPIGLPATTWMIEIGTLLMRSESELVLKSRRVAPTLLLKHGFEFAFPAWPEAARDLASRMREQH